MERATIRILEVFSIPGRADPLAAIEFVHGSFRDLARSSLFTANNADSTWRLKELAQASDLQTEREAAGFMRLSGTGELHAGMELLQADS